MAAGAPHTYIGAPSGPPPANYQQQASDPTGQVAPAGMKPRVTATLWEDEGCMCFQVETKGVCVARRDGETCPQGGDSHMINGTKLLNVAGMTRGRRDGILKSEKTRHVVKIGPMHLKGVWIPFDRALDFANKEKITEELYPLFVHNIGALLYHPTNQSRTSAVMAAQDRRRLGDHKQQGGMPPATQPPSLTHPHSISSTVGNQQHHSIAPSPGPGRPGIERAHTFPTPPTSASGTITGIGSQGSSYDWTGGGINGSVHGGQAMGLETHSHSTPATPATTPPGSTLPSLQPYQNQQAMYAGHGSSHAQYASQQQSMARNGSIQSNPFPKHEMGPPSNRMSGSRPESEHGDVKIESYAQGPTNDVSHSGGSEGTEHEQDPDYTHEGAQAYGSHRGSYSSYSNASDLPSYNGENIHVSSNVNGSSSVNGGSGQGTPRTSQSQWATGYQTPPRAPPSSNLYNPTSDARGSVSNGNTSTEGYVTGAYAPSQLNTLGSSHKRMRDEETDHEPLKRRKMIEGGPVNGAFDDPRSINRSRAASAKTARAR
ncbi:MAG: hypothetical protein Q9163_005851 [Psora crenata]